MLLDICLIQKKNLGIMKNQKVGIMFIRMEKSSWKRKMAGRNMNPENGFMWKMVWEIYGPDGLKRRMTSGGI